MGGERDESSSSPLDQLPRGAERSVEVTFAAHVVVRDRAAFEAHLHETRAQPAKATRHGGIDEAPVGQDGEAEVIAASMSMAMDSISAMGSA